MENKETKTESSMQERFDEQFASATDYIHHYEKGTLTEALKSFIQSEIDLAVAKERERIVKMIEIKRIPVREDIDGVYRLQTDASYNNALDDINKLITNK